MFIALIQRTQSKLFVNSLNSYHSQVIVLKFTVVLLLFRKNFNFFLLLTVWRLGELGTGNTITKMWLPNRWKYAHVQSYISNRKDDKCDLKREEKLLTAGPLKARGTPLIATLYQIT